MLKRWRKRRKSSNHSLTYPNNILLEKMDTSTNVCCEQIYGGLSQALAIYRTFMREMGCLVFGVWCFGCCHRWQASETPNTTNETP